MMARVTQALVVAALVFVTLLAALALALSGVYALLAGVLATGPALLLTAACALVPPAAVLVAAGAAARRIPAGETSPRGGLDVVRRHPLEAMGVALAAGVLVASSQQTRDALTETLARYLDQQR